MSGMEVQILAKPIVKIFELVGTGKHTNDKRLYWAGLITNNYVDVTNTYIPCVSSKATKTYGILLLYSY